MRALKAICDYDYFTVAQVLVHTSNCSERGPPRVRVRNPEHYSQLGCLTSTVDETTNPHRKRVRFLKSRRFAAMGSKV